MDISLLVTILVIFAAALLGSYLRSIQRDRCLKSFDGFHIFVEMKDGRMIWGTMSLESTGMELLYRDSVHDEQHIETSYILYRDEYGNIQAIYRYTDQLTPENIERRNRDLERSFHPGLFRRLGRKTRDFINTASDSVNEALNLVLGRVRAPTVPVITDTSQKYLTQVGKNIIGYVGTRYDPLLERYVGSRVVIEVVEGDTVNEYVGVFKEYSSDFLELLDVFHPEKHTITVSREEPEKARSDVEIRLEGPHLTLSNHHAQPVLLERLMYGEDERALNVVLDPGQDVTLTLEGEVEAVQVEFKVVRSVDMIVPRAHALVRHRAERYDPERFFDIGVSLRWTSEAARREQRLRRLLAQDPTDAASATALAGLLIQRGEWEEARRWLEQALMYSDKLLDHGKRARQQLQRVENELQAMKRS
ncbi:MAG: tetratricopeptide repeat protein [Chloroflexi bacterium]|nr:tetratricopeptide repeat protein [Chloroflexota bacterium]